MNFRSIYCGLIAAAIFFVSCSTAKINNSSGDRVDVTILQINDVYEINPLEGGKTGGLARVAYLAKKYKKENPNFLTVISGDFLNPSAINMMKYEGKRLKGRHMISVLNEFMDIATFGNHEFDIEMNELQERLNESKFDWVSTNVSKMENGKVIPFYKKIGVDSISIHRELVRYFPGKSGRKYPFRFFGVTLDAQKRDFVHYDPINLSVQNLLEKSSVKQAVNVGITHLAIGQDLDLAKSVPNLAILMGGHEHNNAKFINGKTYITKADANAKSAYLHHITYYPDQDSTAIESTLIKIDDSIPFDPSTKNTVDQWTSKVDSLYAKDGFDLKSVICTLKEDLEGRETFARLQPTNLSQGIVDAFRAASKQNAEIAILNTGSIRIDDVVSGTITQYDILRIMPFGGELMETEIKGSEILKLIEVSEKSKGSGAYLVYSGIEQKDGIWFIQGNPIVADRSYKTILSDFLLTGRERNMGFLNLSNPNISKPQRPDPNDKKDLRNDVRLAYIDYLKKNCH